MSHYLAIDVGGTKIAVGIGTDDGRIAVQEVLPTDTGWASEEVLDRIAAVVDRLKTQSGIDDIVSAGLGTPGPLDGPVLLKSANLPGWSGLNWQTGLEKRVSCPVAVENDATAAGAGEWMFGAGRGVRDLLYVTVSTGIGAGIVASGRVLSGSRGNAGEFGHLVMDPHGPACATGHFGCLETLASGTAIRRRAVERQGDSPYLKGLTSLDTKDVFDGFSQSDPVSVAIVEEACDHLALGLSYLVDLFNPERIVVGGGVGAHASQAYYERLRQGIREWSLPAMSAVVQVGRAALGDQSGLVGALALAVTNNTNT